MGSGGGQPGSGVLSGVRGVVSRGLGASVGSGGGKPGSGGLSGVRGW